MTNIRQLVTDHPLFSGMKPQHIDKLLHRASEAKFKPGEFLIREGEPANRLFLITKGRVMLQAHDLANGTADIEELKAGEALGWSWLFPPFVWHFRAKALEATEAVILDAGHLLVGAEEDPKFGFELMKRVAQVLIHRLSATRKQLLTDKTLEAFD